jgi:ankyrin repeat protein
LNAASVPLEGSHASGTLDRANEILSSYPEVGDANVYTAAVLGNADRIAELIGTDSQNAVAKGGPRRWDALTYLCFSRYLRLDESRSDGFARSTRLLLDAGADPNTGWYEKNHQPKPEWESALYGAAGIAHNPEVTRLLVERGADVNDGEVTYHTPETYDNRALEILILSGQLTKDSLATLLLRKSDWHDYQGVKVLLENGADPNHRAHWANTPFQHALLSDNSLEIIEALLDHGADPSLTSTRADRGGHETQPLSGFAIAARYGRSDVLEALKRRGIDFRLEGVDRLIAACAMNDSLQVREISTKQPKLVAELREQGAKLITNFALTDNLDGLRQLLELGVSVDEPLSIGVGYWDNPPGSTALHVASWLAHHDVVKFLIARGANVNARDARGRTPIQRAVKASVDSYWTRRRSPESVAALLQAGATVDGVLFPSGYEEVDRLIAPHVTRR